MQAMRQLFSNSYLARFVAATLCYALVVHLSLYLVPDGSSGASLVWPASAVGLGILFFWGYELWPALMTGLFVVLYIAGITPPLIIATATANALEALIGVYILRRYINLDPMFSSLRHALGFILAAVCATVVSASVITVGVSLFGHAPILNSGLWVGVWIGHLVSLLCFGPFVLRWLARPVFTKTPRELFEGVVLFGSILVLCILLFWTPYTSIGGISLLYVLIIPLIWASLRAGPRGNSLAILILALVGATGTLYGHAPIPTANVSQLLFGMQMVFGTLAVIFLLFTSITEERKEAVHTLEDHVNQLEHALKKISSEDQAKSDFIAMLAHELRNPLSPLLSGVELLKTEAKGDMEILRMMAAHLHTVARLLDDLLDISRISQKKLKLQKEPTEIHGVIARTVEMVQPALTARSHTFSVQLPQEEVWLDGDPVRLGQIFANLLTNAAKYTDPGGTISLAVEKVGGELVAEVRDNGIGIAPERLDKIFEPFGTSEAEERRPGGLRIGLSLAKRMAEMHGGSVAASSAGLGRGTRFVVRLPLPPTKPLPLPDRRGSLVSRMRGRFSKEAIAEGRERLGGRRILVVDDNEAAAQSLGRLLEHSGHTIALAYDAPEAISAAEQFKPDVAILDIGLPTGDGYQLARALRARIGPQLLLIALTGYGQHEDKRKAQEAGFAEHLVKPVSVTDVQRALLDLYSSKV